MLSNSLFIFLICFTINIFLLNSTPIFSKIFCFQLNTIFDYAKAFLRSVLAGVIIYIWFTQPSLNVLLSLFIYSNLNAWNQLLVSLKKKAQFNV